MQPKEREKLNDTAELFYWQKHATVCCFCFRNEYPQYFIFPKEKEDE